LVFSRGESKQAGARPAGGGIPQDHNQDIAQWNFVPWQYQDTNQWNFVPRLGLLPLLPKVTEPCRSEFHEFHAAAI